MEKTDKTYLLNVLSSHGEEKAIQVLESYLVQNPGREENEAFDFFSRIDFSELRNQKRNLLDVIRKVTEHSLNNPNNAIVTVEEVNSLDAILHLIDALQDCAVDKLKLISSIHVYDFEDEERRDD
jgi:DNA polymerase III delta prime subunit